jgi:outer membrane protein OmpA-like peptidoglycan-associated protein
MRSSGILIVLLAPFFLSAQDTTGVNNTKKVRSIINRFDAITGPDKVPETKNISYNTKAESQINNLSDSLNRLYTMLVNSDRKFLVLKYGDLREENTYNLERYNDFQANQFLISQKRKVYEIQVYFPFGLYNTDLTLYAELNQLSDKLQQNENSKIYINGMTDSLGNQEFNQTLSEKRADVVKEYLIVALRIDPTRIVTNGFGSKSKERFIDSDLDFMNRRVLIRVE